MFWVRSHHLTSVGPTCQLVGETKFTSQAPLSLTWLINLVHIPLSLVSLSRNHMVHMAGVEMWMKMEMRSRWMQRSYWYNGIYAQSCKSSLQINLAELKKLFLIFRCLWSVECDLLLHTNTNTNHIIIIHFPTKSSISSYRIHLRVLKQCSWAQNASRWLYYHPHLLLVISLDLET